MAAAAAAAPVRVAAPPPPAPVQSRGAVQESQLPAEQQRTVTFPEATVAALQSCSFPAGTVLHSPPFNLLGLRWRFKVWPLVAAGALDPQPTYPTSQCLRAAVELLEPECTIAPARIHIWFPGVNVSSTHLDMSNVPLSSKAVPPPARKPCVDVPLALLTVGKKERHAQAGGVLAVTVMMQAATVGCYRAAEAWAAPEGCTLIEMIHARSETMADADTTVALDGKGKGAAATTAPLRVHSFMLLLRCGARASLGTMAQGGAAPFTLAAPSGVGGDAMRIFIRFLYRDKEALPDTMSFDTLCELLTAADYFDVPLLLEVCEKRLADALSPSNMLATLQLAALYSRTRLRVEALRFVAKYLTREVMESEVWRALPQPLVCDVVETVKNGGEPPLEAHTPPRAAARPREEEAGPAEPATAAKRARGCQ